MTNETSDDSGSAWRKQLGLTDWALVFGLPSDRRSFEMGLETGQFCKRYRDWPAYEKRLVKPFEELFGPLERRGLRVIRNASRSDFAAGLDGRFAVLLFSHCNSHDNTIEFREGMSKPSEFCKGVPNCTFLLDLCVCSPDPDGIVGAIKEQLPACRATFMRQDLKPVQWAKYYAFVLDQFVSGRKSYIEVMEIVNRHIQNLWSGDPDSNPA